jgi:hypothetical protein
MYTFEIDENNAVKIFAEGQEAPVIFQPDWPNGTAWGSAEEATAWAELYIESFTNPEGELLPGYSPEEPTREKPVSPVTPETPAE